MKVTNNVGTPEQPAAERESEIGPLAVGEVAELLGIVPRTVIKYIDQGKLRAEKIGNRHQVWLPRAMLPERGLERPERRSVGVAEHSDVSPAAIGAVTVPAGRAEPRHGDPDGRLAPLLDRLASLERKIDALVDEFSSARDGCEDALISGEEVIAALRRRAEGVEGDRALMQACLREVRALREELAANRQAVGPWHRLRRLLIGTANDDDEW